MLLNHKLTRYFYSLLKRNFEKHTTPFVYNTEEGVLYWREKTLLYLLYVFMLFVPIAYFPSIILGFINKLWLLIFIDTIAYLLLIYVFFNKSLSIPFRAYFILILTYVLGVFLLLNVGPYGAGYLCLFAVPIIAAILLDMRAAAFFLAVNLITLISLGVMISYDVLPKSAMPGFTSGSWHVITANFIFLDIIATLSIIIIIRGLEKSLINEINISHSLEVKSAELRTAMEEAEKANQLKSYFLAQMSHEIRTPINTILSFISLIKEDLQERNNFYYNEYFTIIGNGSRRIIRTIDMILNMSEIQTKSYNTNFEKLSLMDDILNPLITEFQLSAQKKNLYLKIISKINCEDILLLDKYSCIQIFTNLIDNAIKYTKEGGISIEIENGNKSIIIKICDTGIGISKVYQGELFKPFSQEECGYTRNYEGNGLGLALVKSYCDLNNSDISFISEKGKGTTFSVKFKANCRETIADFNN